ncbi:MAG TPA: hypothetical protein VGN12_05950 [Pirellulales bacterium]|jgi:hypothetical protein
MGTPANDTRKDQQTGQNTQRQDDKNRQDFQGNPNASKGQNPMHKQQEHRGQNMKEEGDACGSEQGQQGQQKKAEEQCHTQGQNAGQRASQDQNK